ncbi:uncharacterized protein LOC106667166 [Cimex lectularius]|uniref:Uncharacterized protein n=1 Tax=Cimex lectularius TaxID=79782 RepID=A0A8I6SJI6_CIMLE|nr:uncharacterized protein LOC106667166 [Cimex lectularius]XP_024082399.1 uncharacterized protein LOC106667166 [Cimex lectularius]
MKKKLTLIVTGNGTVDVYEEEDYLWPEALGFILIIGTVLNLTLIGVTTTMRYKGHFPHLVTALSFVTAYDSIVNQTLSLLFILEWYDSAVPRFLCRFSMISSVFSLLVQLSYVACISTTSLINKRQCPVTLYVVLPPIIASALVAPPVIMNSSVVPVHHYVQRNACGMTGDNIIYSSFLLIIGFTSSLTALVYFLVFMKCYICDSGVLTCNTDEETRDQRYIAVLIIVCFFTLVPYTVSVNVTNFIPLRSLRRAAIGSSVVKIITGKYDTALVFLKNCFNFTFPLVTFLFFKEYRKQFSSLFCICRRNSVSADGLNSESSRRSSKLKDSEETTPVLFCTARGLILRIKEGKSDTNYYYQVCDRYGQMESVMQSTSTEESIRMKKPVGPRRKFVRFSHYVKEIPPSLTEWDFSDNEGGSQIS